jgi:phage gp16-like protein
MSARQKTPDERRRSQLAAIHVIAGLLKMDRDTYEALLTRVAGVTSASQLDAAGRNAVLDELHRLNGDEVKARYPDVGPQAAPIHPRAELKPMLAKIEVLLAKHGRGWPYAHGIAERMFGAARLEWLKPAQLRKVVAALAYDDQRHAPD